MSLVPFRGQQADISTGTSTKTLLQIVAAANHGVRVKKLSTSFQGTTTTNEPILTQILRQTDAGTASSLTLVKDPDDTDETLQTTAQHTATAEPTAGAIMESENIHPQQGYTWYYPPYDPMKIGGGDRVALRVNTPANSVDAAVAVSGEE